MDTLEAIKKLARLAREESAPATDVSARVLMEIRQREESPREGKEGIAPLWIFAAGSVAAAAMVAVVAYCSISWNDPLIALFAPFQMVML